MNKIDVNNITKKKNMNMKPTALQNTANVMAHPMKWNRNWNANPNTIAMSHIEASYDGFISEFFGVLPNFCVKKYDGILCFYIL